MSGRPADAPSTGTAERLEKVRQQRGVPTVRAFVDRLNEGQDFEVKYDTARRYHRDRRPSLRYVVEVARVYDVNLEWLATGEGDPKDVRIAPKEVAEPEARRMWVREGLSEGFFGDPDQHPADQMQLDALIDVWVRAAIRTLGSMEYATTEERELAVRIGKAAAAPLRAFGLDPGSIRGGDLIDYLQTVVPAFVIANRAVSTSTEEENHATD